MANRSGASHPHEAPPTEAERVAQLHAECDADYGTPEERAERQQRALEQSSMTFEYAQAAARVLWGRRL
ncbi:hypothetical protein ACFY8S_01750 [Streptomyces hygroscopicus]|uniref:hypothetical protein n=1 Tax=Streptomyces hygroscopicus TaxID=1912 RepID=UPI00368EFCC4